MCLRVPDLKTRHWQLGQQVGGADAMALKAELEAIFVTRTLAQWTEPLPADCCVSPVLRTEEALAHPLFQHIVARRTHETEGEYWAVSPTVRFTS
jgi:alpha-methylacyl-CoA racemase